jgi:hypothetical protein
MITGLTRLFQALRSLTEEITRTASLFKTANDQLEARLTVDPQIDEVVDHENGQPKRLSRAKV